MWTTLKYGLVVFLISIIGLNVVNTAQKSLDANSGIVIIAVLTVFGVVTGLGTGRLKAFNLKLEAQRILCQLQIEHNTRAGNKTMPAVQR